MSKGQSTGEKGEKTKETMRTPTAGEAKGGEPKRHDGPQSKGKNAMAGLGGCVASGCKTTATRFNFCNEHYDQFKFGLIKKTGDPVPDFEKKFEHYMAYKAKQKGKRVA
jgi:hypothetical protein